jgi:hypothetical protein
LHLFSPHYLLSYFFLSVFLLIFSPSSVSPSFSIFLSGIYFSGSPPDPRQDSPCRLHRLKMHMINSSKLLYQILWLQITQMICRKNGDATIEIVKLNIPRFF